MKTAIAIVATLILGGMASLWLANAFPGDASASDTHRSNSESTKARIEARVIRAIGYIEPTSELRKLTFKRDGILDSMKVSIGQTVERGQILATLDNREEQAAVAVAEEQLAIAQAERNLLAIGPHPSLITAAEHQKAESEARVKEAQRHYDRVTPLSRQEISTEDEYDTATSELEQSKEALQVATARLNELRTHVREEDLALADTRVGLAVANLAAARIRLQDTSLLAPLQGAVLEIVKREGESVRAVDPVPVLIMADMSQLRIRVEVDERFVSDVRIGQRTVATGRSMGTRRIEGSVVQTKDLMGDKTLFTRNASERKDLQVLQVFVQPDEAMDLPIGLQVDLDIFLSDSDSSRAL